MNERTILIRDVILLISALCALTAKTESIPDPAWLHDKLAAVRKKYELPAIAAAVVSHGQIIAASAVGYRRLGNTTQPAGSVWSGILPCA